MRRSRCWWRRRAACGAQGRCQPKWAPLGTGRLRLESGLARIVFSSGAELQLESPAEVLELVSSMKCIVRTGKLVAHVPPSAKGFVVETPSSIITDFGTEFGVSVGHDESAVVQVFEGRVDTLHRRSGRTEIMLEGSTLHFGQKEYGPYGDIEPSVVNRDTTPNRVCKSGFKSQRHMGVGKMHLCNVKRFPTSTAKRVCYWSSFPIRNT